MTEWVVDDERWMNVVPRSLRDVGVLVEPLTIAEKALAQVPQIQQRLPWACPASGGSIAGGCHRAVVLGAGPVGLLGAMALVADGFDTYVYSRGGADSPRARLAAEIGATFVPAETVAVGELAKKVGAIDLVYEATGVSSLAFDVLAVLGTNGIFVLTGVPGRRAPMQVDTDLLMRKPGAAEPGRRRLGEREPRRLRGRDPRSRALQGALAEGARRPHHRAFPDRRVCRAAPRDAHRRHQKCHRPILTTPSGSRPTASAGSPQAPCAGRGRADTTRSCSRRRRRRPAASSSVNGFDAWVATGERHEALSAQRYVPAVVHPDGARADRRLPSRAVAALDLSSR